MVMKSELKELIKGDCTFEFYRAGHLYYRTENGELLFPIDITDVGNSTLNHREKGIILMRYIRRQMDVIKLNKAVETIDES